MATLFPVRCYTCGKVISGMETVYLHGIYTDGREPADVLDGLGVTRMCCRTRFITHPWTQATLQLYRDGEMPVHRHVDRHVDRPAAATAATPAATATAAPGKRVMKKKISSVPVQSTPARPTVVGSVAVPQGVRMVSARDPKVKLNA